MRYSLHITAIPNQRAYTIVAHNLAGNRNVSLHYAQSLLENFPVVYMADLSGDNAQNLLRQLTKIGVKAHMVAFDAGNIPIIKTDGAAPVSASPPSPDASAAASVRAPVASKVSFIFKEDPVDNSPKNSSARRNLVAACVIFAVMIAAAGLFFTKQKWRLAVHPAMGAGILADSAALKKNGQAFKTAGFHGTDSQSMQIERDSIPEQTKMKAQAYADSAKICTSAEASITFYKIAIGFNKFNADAWYGLVNAYEQSGQEGQAAAARQAMKRIFGDTIFRLSTIVGRYGTLGDYRLGSDGTFRMEYRSRAADTQAILLETYHIAKAFGALCNCAALSLYASAAARGGVLVYIKTDASAVTYDQFRAAAVVKRLE